MQGVTLDVSHSPERWYSIAVSCPAYPAAPRIKPGDSCMDRRVKTDPASAHWLLRCRVFPPCDCERRAQAPLALASRFEEEERR